MYYASYIALNDRYSGTECRRNVTNLRKNDNANTKEKSIRIRVKAVKVGARTNIL
jgi:hypothetical protein